MEDKIVSFVGIAPMDHPRYIVLVALDTPSPATGYYISGGQMGAPTVRDVLGDVLPYLGIQPDYSQEEAARADVSVPDVSGMTTGAAKEALAEKQLTFRSQGDGETVTEQVPPAGAVIPGGSEIVLYFGAHQPVGQVTVPDVVGKDAETANALLTGQGLYMKIIGASGEGSIVAASQRPEAGQTVGPGTVVEVEFSDLGARD